MPPSLPRPSSPWAAPILVGLFALAGLQSLWPVAPQGAGERLTAPQWRLSSNAGLWPALDHMLQRLPLDEHQRVRTDGRTAAALQRATAAVEQPLVAAERDRITLLMERALPGPAAAQAQRLLTGYLAYRTALAEQPDRQDPDTRRRLQRAHLGEAAGGLFREENALREAIHREARNPAPARGEAP